MIADLVATWRETPVDAAWTVATAFGTAAACGLVGVFVVLRRMAMVGDAISHSVLPGLVVAFLLAGSRATTPLLLGGLAAAFVTVALVELLTRGARLRVDAAIGIAFSTLFALGVVLVQLFAGHVDLDADCVLHGELAFVPFAERVVLGGMDLGPLPAVRILAMLGVVAALVVVGYKELLLTSFDESLAAALGAHPGRWRAGITGVLAMVVVLSFEAVGAILVTAMVVFPGATALLMTRRLPRALAIVVLLSAWYAFAGHALGVALDASLAGAITTVAFATFAVAWLARQAATRRRRG